MSRPRIFVPIPSYRDRECQWTLRDMFERARHPDRVFAAVCWQTVPEEDADCFLVRPRPDQVRTANFHVREARGLGWARAKAQALWQGEEYTLQIDSHMRFVDDWDERMIDTLAACDSPDPVLTHYPASYYPPDTREVFDRPRVQMIRRFLPNGLMEFGTEAVPADVAADRPLPTAAVAGGFIFGGSRILRDVPSDPEIYFNGEGPNLAVRLWTWGFDLFSPPDILIYHYYYRKDGSRHWNDAVTRETQELIERTLRRLRLLCEPDAFRPEEVAALGRYGLGPRRSLADYQAFAGVNFAARTFAVETRHYPWVRPPAVRATLALPDTLRPAPGTQLFVLGNEGVLFGETKGTLHRLNEAAAITWCALQAGRGWEQIAAETAATRGIALDVALAELRELAAHWIDEGLLLDVPPDSPSGPRLDPARFDFRTRDYRLLDSVIRLRFGDAAIEALVHPAFAHLEVESAGTTPTTMLAVLRILDWHYIFAGEQVLMVDETERKLVPRLKVEVMGRAINQQHHILHLHSAAVMHAERLVLFPAGSGRGKTLLTARLLSLGCEYFSDEAVLLRRDGMVRPIPTALSVKAGGVAQLAPHYPGLEALPEHDREDGVSVRYLPPPRSSVPAYGRAARPAAVVFPRYVPGATTTLRLVSAADALGRLLAECLAIPRRLDTDAVATIVETIERASCWELVGGDLDAAARQVMALAERAAAP